MKQATIELLNYGALGAVTVVLFALVVWILKQKSKDNEMWRDTVERVADKHNETLTASLERVEKAHERSGDKISSAIERALLNK